MKIAEYLAVPGTYASRRSSDGWNALTSPFTRYALARGLVSVEERALVPFRWSTDINCGSGRHDDWRALGYALYYYFDPPLREDLRIPGYRTRIIAHSHAGQGVFYAASYGLKIECLVTVGTPVVRQMDEVIEQARPNIKRWLHLYSKFDFWQILGAFHDGRIGIYRKFKQADRNEVMPKGHADVLCDPQLFHLWVDNGWFDYMVEGE